MSGAICNPPREADRIMVPSQEWDESDKEIPPNYFKALNMPSEIDDDVPPPPYS